MRLLAILPLIGVLAACGGRSRQTLFAEDDRRPADEDSAIEERKAREALADIEKKIARGDLPKIQFEFDKAEITPESFPTLNLIHEILSRSERLKLFVLAHTDSIGTQEYNLDLSERRAKAVKEFLVKKGLPPPTIRYRGYGFSKPRADNSTEEGRAKNRRVEFRVTTRDWNTIY
ncbi:MAG: OmpA family protein [Elusimicrobiota bacterium]